MDFLTGLMIEAVGLLLLVGGFLAGWKARGAALREGGVSAKSPDAEEARKLEAEQEAFQKMMGYSVETAYGLNKEERIGA